MRIIVSVWPVVVPSCFLLSLFGWSTTALFAASPAGKTLYRIGSLTNEEQAYVEYVNRARLDPKAEGRRLARVNDPVVLGAYRYFDIDFDLLLYDPDYGFDLLPPTGALVPNARLTQAARRHTRDLVANRFQGHTGSDGSTFDERINDTGYRWRIIGENVGSYVTSVLEGHCGFNVDWGQSASGGSKGGMQDPPRHRQNIHDPDFREIGVGVITLPAKLPAPNNGIPIGPQVVTQEFGARIDQESFVTGVAYHDLNGNEFYDPGEGLGGVDVTVEGSTFYAITESSGGYGVPVPRAGDYRVIFSGNGFSTKTVWGKIIGDDNVKIDFTPAYHPPQIIGPGEVGIGTGGKYNTTPTGGATNWEWRRSQLAAVNTTEGAETGLENFEPSPAKPFPMRSSSIKASGRFSFHLQHDTFDSVALIWSRTFLPGTAGRLSFMSRLGLATPDQVARVQVQVDGQAGWTEVWSQPGSVTGSHSGKGETQFQRRTINLSSFADRSLRFRFVFAFASGSAYLKGSNSHSVLGWYFDELEFSNTQEIVEAQQFETPPNEAYRFAPETEGDWLLQVRPYISGRWFPYGPPKRVKSVIEATIFRIAKLELIADKANLEFAAQPGGRFSLLAANSPDGRWTPRDNFAIAPLAGGYRISVPTQDAEHQFYRVRLLR